MGEGAEREGTRRWLGRAMQSPGADAKEVSLVWEEAQREQRQTLAWPCGAVSWR